MEKDKYYDILNKIFACLIIIITILAMNLILTVAGGNNTTVKESNTNNTEESGYDVSDLNEIDVDEALKLFDSKEAQVILFARPDCGACVSFMPVIKEVQKDLGFTTNYININNVEQNDSLDKLLKKMDIETKVNLSDGEKEGTFGEFFGLTPTVIIVKDGKMKAGLIGYNDTEDYTKFLNDNGIKKAK